MKAGYTGPYVVAARGRLRAAIRRDDRSSCLRHTVRGGNRRMGVGNSEHRRPSSDMIANFDVDLGSGRKDHINARSELDQSYTLAADHLIADLLGENDAARQQTGNLLKDDGFRFAAHRNYVLLVFFG